MHIVISAASCGVFHYLCRFLPFKTRNASNLLTCTVFQTYFVFQAFRLLFSEPSDQVSEQTLVNLSCLYGYFIYDLIYMLKTDPTSPFIVHHLIGIMILHRIREIGAPISLLSHYNAICVLGEVMSPFLNLRHFFKNTRLYPIWMRGIYYAYFVSRIVSFPIVSSSLVYQLRSHELAGTLVIVYGMSLFWFYEMHRKK
jgi:hypothetical protein